MKIKFLSTDKMASSKSCKNNYPEVCTDGLQGITIYHQRAM